MAAERAGRADVFFYGLFMDQDLLRAKGIEPEGADLAFVEGLVLRIGQRAALAPEPGGRAHGVVMSLALPDLVRLYSEPSLEPYKPQPVLARLASGRTVTALCYNLPEPPLATEHNPEYAARLRSVAQKVGLPAEYVSSIK